MAEKTKPVSVRTLRRDITRTTPKDFRDGSIYVARIIPDALGKGYREVYLLEFWKQGAGVPAFVVADHGAKTSDVEEELFFEWDEVEGCWYYTEKDIPIPSGFNPVPTGAYWIIGPVRGA